MSKQYAIELRRTSQRTSCRSYWANLEALGAPGDISETSQRGRLYVSCGVAVAFVLAIFKASCLESQRAFLSASMALRLGKVLIELS
jgi:hypothetical protein